MIIYGLAAIFSLLYFFYCIATAKRRSVIDNMIEILLSLLLLLASTTLVVSHSEEMAGWLKTSLERVGGETFWNQVFAVSFIVSIICLLLGEMDIKKLFSRLR